MKNKILNVTNLNGSHFNPENKGKLLFNLLNKINTKADAHFLGVLHLAYTKLLQTLKAGPQDADTKQAASDESDQSFGD